MCFSSLENHIWTLFKRISSFVNFIGETVLPTICQFHFRKNVHHKLYGITTATFIFAVGNQQQMPLFSSSTWLGPNFASVGALIRTLWTRALVTFKPLKSWLTSNQSLYFEIAAVVINDRHLTGGCSDQCKKAAAPVQHLLLWHCWDSVETLLWLSWD